jgi:hypothetical protein
MAFKDLSATDQGLALQCMKVIADGSEIEDWEFQTRLGITRPTLKEIISMWPEIDDSAEDSDEFLAINNCFNEICHGIHIPPIEWEKSFSQPRDTVKQAYANWLRLKQMASGGIR